jgi:hypothetical protein
MTGFCGFAIGISPDALELPPLSVVQAFEHAASIAARLGTARALPPARTRKSRRLIGCDRRPAAIETSPPRAAVRRIDRRFKSP